MVVCVTGPMAAGKNAASDILEKMGFACIDADKVGHIAVENARDKILQEFQEKANEKKIPLLDKDGHIIRRNLGALIFGDKDLVQLQEQIVYPEINRILEDFIEENKGKNVVINAAVLYKVPLIKKMDMVIYIDAPLFIRFFRAKKRDGMSTKQILARFRSQKNLFAKYNNSGADIRRVRNTGSRKNLEKKIQAILPDGDSTWNRKKHFGSY